jgi:hypothetical protein
LWHALSELYTDRFEARGLTAFGEDYAKGRNFVVSPQVTAGYARRFGNLEVRFAPMAELRALLRGAAAGRAAGVNPGQITEHALP